MKQITLKQSGLVIPAIAAGCMRIADKSNDEIQRHIGACIESGINFFDHADIYGRGVCEEKFGQALKGMNIKREEILIQSKCSIVPGVMYNMSKDYILNAVDGILSRLGCGYLDSLLMHRPDALVEPEEVAEAFDILYSSGKVRHFGVSNHKPMQIELLKRFVKQPLEYNQMQMSIPVCNMIANGIEVNMTTECSLDRDGSVLDYCRLNDITIQTWSPFQFGFFEGVFVGNYDRFPDLNHAMDRLAYNYGVSSSAIAVAWILRHPANMQTILGTTSPDRIRDIAKAADVSISREEWYELYLKAGHQLP